MMLNHMECIRLLHIQFRFAKDLTKSIEGLIVLKSIEKSSPILAL